MIYFLNGAYVEQSEACISAEDRGWLYGDSVFETVCCSNFTPFRWKQHWTRLNRGCEILGFNLEFDEAGLGEILTKLSRINRLPHCTQRITVSRGSGGIGYSPKGANQCTVLVTLRPASFQRSPRPLRLVTFREWTLDPRSLPTHIKHSNRLIQVLGRRFADHSQADDSIMLSTDGCVAETTSANLFWFRDNHLYTPHFSTGCLPGIGRELVIELWLAQGASISEVMETPESIQSSAGVFMVNAAKGIMPVGFIDGLPIQSDPIVAKLDILFERIRSA